MFYVQRYSSLRHRRYLLRVTAKFLSTKQATLGLRNLKTGIHTTNTGHFELCVWAKLCQGNHAAIATISFSQAPFLICFQSTRKHLFQQLIQQSLFTLFRYKGKIRQKRNYRKRNDRNYTTICSVFFFFLILFYYSTIRLLTLFTVKQQLLTLLTLQFDTYTYTTIEYYYLLHTYYYYNWVPLPLL